MIPLFLCSNLYFYSLDFSKTIGLIYLTLIIGITTELINKTIVIAKCMKVVFQLTIMISNPLKSNFKNLDIPVSKMAFAIFVPMNVPPIIKIDINTMLKRVWIKNIFTKSTLLIPKHFMTLTNLLFLLVLLIANTKIIIIVIIIKIILK